MPPTFLLNIVGLLKKGVEWLKLRPEDPSINISSPRQDINIKNLQGQNISIIINNGAKDYDPLAAKEVFSNLKSDIENHEPIGLQFDSSLSIATGQKLNSTQKNQIELFKKAMWSSDKIASIKSAFKIINLEDTAQYEEAKNLMTSAFNGHKRSMNKKFYNLARAGYLEGFAMRLLFSNELHSDEAITKILDYFPEAIFIDEGTDVLKFIQELQRRERSNIKRVSVYARGDRHISDLNYFYGQYIHFALKTETEVVTSFFPSLRSEYKIASDNALRLELELMSVKEQN